MKIKKFNQLNEERTYSLDHFIRDVKKVVNYDEDDFEQGDEPSNSDLMVSVGELINAYELSTADLQQIVDENPNDWEINTFVKPHLDYDLAEQSGKKQLFDDIKDIIKDNKDVDKAVEEIIRYFNDKRKY